MREMIGIGVSAALGLLLLGTAARAADKPEKIAPDKLPQRIADSLKARFPGAKVNAAEKETENGKVVYDLEFTVKGHKYESDIAEDGTMLEYEKEIPAKSLPGAVSRALKAKYPQATIQEAMEVNVVKGKDEKPDHYEVTLKTAGKSQEVTVSLDGTKIGEEGAEPQEKK